MLHLSPPKALVVDLDGTLIDSEGLALDAWTTSASALKLPLSAEFFEGLIGLNSVDIAERLQSELQCDSAVEDLRKESWKIYEDLIAGGVPLKSGARELLLEARNNGIPCAVATSSSRKTAEQKLSAVELRGLVQVVSTGDQVSKGKPSPEIFLRAADELNIAPSYCWAAEDSAVGVKAASSSGMTTWMVVDRVSPTQEIRKMASSVVDSLHEVLEVLKRTLAR